MISYPRQQELNWAAFEYADSAAVLYRWDANEKNTSQLRGMKRSSLVGLFG